MKNLLNLKGAKTLNNVEQKAINGGGGKLCNGSCSVVHANCWYQGHCGCPGECGNVPGQGLTCIPY